MARRDHGDEVSTAMRRKLPLLDLAYEDPNEALARCLICSDSGSHRDWLAFCEVYESLARNDQESSGTPSPYDRYLMGVFTYYEMLDRLLEPIWAALPIDRASVDWLGHLVEAAIIGQAEIARDLATQYLEVTQSGELERRCWSNNPDDEHAGRSDPEERARDARRTLERILGPLPSISDRPLIEPGKVVWMWVGGKLVWSSVYLPLGRYELAEAAIYAAVAGVHAPLVCVYRLADHSVHAEVLIVREIQVNGEVAGHDLLTNDDLVICVDDAS